MDRFVVPIESRASQVPLASRVFGSLMGIDTVLEAASEGSVRIRQLGPSLRASI